MKSSEESINGHNLPSPPDGNFSWIIMFCTTFIDCLVRGLMRSFGILFKEMRQEFKTNNANITVLLGLTNSVGKFIGPLIGFLLVKTSCRFVVLLGGIAVSLGLLLTSFINHLEYVFFTLGILLGIGNTLCEFSNKIILSHYFKRRITIAHSVRITGGAVGGIIFPITVHYLLINYSLRGTFLLLSGLMMHILIFGSLFFPLSLAAIKCKKNIEVIIDPQEKDLFLNDSDCNNKNNPNLSQTNHEFQFKKHSTVCSTNIGIEPHQNAPQILLRKLSHKDIELEILRKTKFNCCIQFRNKYPVKICCSGIFILYTLVTSLIQPATANFLTILPVFVEDSLISKKDAAVLLTILGTLDVIGRLLCGFLVDLLKLRKERCYMTFCILCGILIFLFPLLPQFYILASLCALFGIFHGSLVPLISALVVDVFGSAQLPMVLGFQYPMNGLMSIVFPFLIGYLADYTSNFKISLFLLGSTFLLVALLMFCTTFFYNYENEKDKSICHT